MKARQDNNKLQMKSIKLRKSLKHEEFAENKKILDSNLWKKLSHPLHDLVFFRLPINEICRLRCLSKTWKYKTPPTSSSFTQNCQEACPIMLFLITIGVDGYILVRTLDVKRNKWYTYKFKVHGNVTSINTGGIGLICSSTREVDCSPQIYLTNPLTRDLYHLPAIPNEWRLNHVQKLGNHVVVSMREEGIHSMNYYSIDYTRAYVYDLMDENRKWTLSQPNNQKVDFHGLSSYHTTIENSNDPSIFMASVYHDQSFYVLWSKPPEEDLNIPSIATKFYIKEYHNPSL